MRSVATADTDGSSGFSLDEAGMTRRRDAEGLNVAKADDKHFIRFWSGVITDV